MNPTATPKLTEHPRTAPLVSRRSRRRRSDWEKVRTLALLIAALLAVLFVMSGCRHYAEEVDYSREVTKWRLVRNEYGHCVIRAEMPTGTGEVFVSAYICDHAEAARSNRLKNEGAK